jgi:hypothetical protein
LSLLDLLPDYLRASQSPFGGYLIKPSYRRKADRPNPRSFAFLVLLESGGGELAYDSFGHGYYT